MDKHTALFILLYAMHTICREDDAVRFLQLALLDVLEKIDFQWHSNISRANAFTCISVFHLQSDYDNNLFFQVSVEFLHNTIQAKLVSYTSYL